MMLLLLTAIYCADEKPTVYFTKDISPESLVTLYDKLGIKLTGKIALKVHSGEANGPYFLRPKFLKKIYDHVGGTFVECNTAYNSGRGNTEKHMQTARTNGWVGGDVEFQVMDEHANNDYELKIEPHTQIAKNIVGEHLKDYNSCLVLSHLKGHGMGGFGGALKQLSIGFASKAGKSYIHSGGKNSATQEEFTKAMADSASSIVKFFRDQEYGGIAFINVMVNISKDCDCAGTGAAKPEIQDIGVLASLDPVAIDQASIDLIKDSKECDGKTKWLAQLDRQLGENTIKIAEELGVGSREYKLIDLDEE